MKPFLLALACLSACATAPRPNSTREISTARPGAPNAWSNVHLTDLGISLTLPNGHWSASASPDGTALNIVRAGKPLEMQLRFYETSELDELNGGLRLQRARILRKASASGIRVSAIEDDHDGRRSFTISIPGSGGVAKIIKRTLAPIPGRLGQIIMIEVSGPQPVYDELAAATRFIVESIRPLGVSEAIITAPGS